MKLRKTKDSRETQLQSIIILMNMLLCHFVSFVKSFNQDSVTTYILNIWMLCRIAANRSHTLAIISEFVNRIPGTTPIQLPTLRNHSMFVIRNHDQVRQILNDRKFEMCNEENLNHIFANSFQNSGNHPIYWKQMREALRPWFHKELPKTIPDMVDYFVNDLPSWNQVEGTDLHHTLCSCLIRAQMKVFFGYDLKMRDPRSKISFIALTNRLVYDQYLPAFSSKEVDWLNDQAEQMIDGAPDGSLGAALKGVVEGLNLDRTVLLDNVRLLIFAMTPSFPIFWTILHLLRNPDMMTNARKDKVFLKRCVKEALRMYPPVPVLSSRFPTKDHNFGDGFEVRKGDILFISGLWFVKDSKFNPYRWAADDIEINPKQPTFGTKSEESSYFPFGAGAHTCVARYFAGPLLVELLWSILQNSEVELTLAGDPLANLPLDQQRMSHFNGIFHRPAQPVFVNFKASVKPKKLHINGPNPDMLKRKNTSKRSMKLREIVTLKIRKKLRASITQ